MASIAGYPARRWSLTALLRRLQPSPHAVQVAADVAGAGERRAPRRHYPPQRDGVFERSAMAREMYRL